MLNPELNVELEPYITGVTIWHLTTAHKAAAAGPAPPESRQQPPCKAQLQVGLASPHSGHARAHALAHLPRGTPSKLTTAQGAIDGATACKVQAKGSIIV